MTQIIINIAEILLCLLVMLYIAILEYGEIPHLKDVIDMKDTLLKYEQQYNLNLGDMYTDVNKKYQDLLKRVENLQRENKELKADLKWYQVRMDIKRKHK